MLVRYGLSDYIHEAIANSPVPLNQSSELPMKLTQFDKNADCIDRELSWFS